MKTTIYRATKFALALCLIISFSACEDLLEKKPPRTGSSILPDDAVESIEDVQEILVSAYEVMGNTYDGNMQNLQTLLSDNLVRPFNQNDYTSVWLRSSSIFNTSVGNRFYDNYVAILRANTVLENLDLSSTTDQRNQIEAEARFIRAFSHFNAVRTWARATGYTTDDSHPGVATRSSSAIVNAPRSSVAGVYNFILADIEFAKNNLPDANPPFATIWAAKALEAEVRFQRHEYDAALVLADDVLNNAPYSFDPDVNRFQYPNPSPEAIFYIVSTPLTATGGLDNRSEAFRDSYRGQSPPLRIQLEFYNQLRSIGGGLTPRGELYQELNQDGNISYITTMFDAEVFQIPIFTLTQMLLIRAESLAETNQNLAQAIDDINFIRERAYGSNVANLLPDASADQVITAARNERRMEFPFTGQRYFDLVRIGSQGEDVIVRGAPWDCPGMILQFPSTEQTDLFPLNVTGGC